MSDIQEEIKKAHRKALEQDFNEILKELKQEEHKNLVLNNIINKAIEYIWSTKYEYGDLEEDNEDFDIDVYELLNILKGDNK